MRKPRSQIVDPERTCLYHITSRCVNGAFLLQDDEDVTKRFTCDRLRTLTTAFTIGVSHYGILDNHLHLIIRLDPRAAERLTSRAVVERWVLVHPPRRWSNRSEESRLSWIEKRMRDPAWIARTRVRLGNLGEFMKDLKQPVAERVNERLGRFGPLWAGRYKSDGITDLAGLLATGLYVDLNVFAAGGYPHPEDAPYSSLHERSTAVQRHGVDRADAVSWLIPIAAEVETSTKATSSDRCSAGLLVGLSLLAYLKLVDAAARVVRDSKAHLSKEARPILERLGVDGAVVVSLLHGLRQGVRRGSRGGATRKNG